MKRRLVVSGLIGSIPMAGLTLHYLQYVLGFRSLGHDVLYMEDTGAWYYDPATDGMVDDRAVPLSHLEATMARYGLEGAWTFVDHTGKAWGVRGRALRDYLRGADLFVNVTGAGLMRDECLGIPHRAYIDTDPGYVQVRAANGSEKDLEHLRRHTVHFTFGGNVGAPDCEVPTLGLDWRPTVQPICLSLWPVPPPPAGDAPLSTVLKWQTYAAVEHRGRVYGPKEQEFRRFADLPGRVRRPIELAAAGPPPVADLEARGWRVRDAREISGSIDRYRGYIQASRGEWSVAKNGYVAMRTGWFGDRSASYLASARPVAVQSTGFERWLPTGDCVFAFRDLDEAVAAIEAIDRDHAARCRRARELAEERFAAERVLARLLDQALA